jgi:hypothetical protein
MAAHQRTSVLAGISLLKAGAIAQLVYWVIIRPVKDRLAADYPWLAPAFMWGSLLLLALGAVAVSVSGQTKPKSTSHD